MNLVEINQLTECRKKLNNIHPKCPIEQVELIKVKEIIDDMLEFKVLPNFPGCYDSHK